MRVYSCLHGIEISHANIEASERSLLALIIAMDTTEVLRLHVTTMLHTRQYLLSLDKGDGSCDGSCKKAMAQPKMQIEIEEEEFLLSRLLKGAELSCCMVSTVEKLPINQLKMVTDTYDALNKLRGDGLTMPQMRELLGDMINTYANVLILQFSEYGYGEKMKELMGIISQQRINFRFNFDFEQRNRTDLIQVQKVLLQAMVWRYGGRGQYYLFPNAQHEPHMSKAMTQIRIMQVEEDSFNGKHWTRVLELMQLPESGRATRDKFRWLLSAFFYDLETFMQELCEYLNRRNETFETRMVKAVDSKDFAFLDKSAMLDKSRLARGLLPIDGAELKGEIEARIHKFQMAFSEERRNYYSSLAEDNLIHESRERTNVDYMWEYLPKDTVEDAADPLAEIPANVLKDIPEDIEEMEDDIWEDKLEEMEEYLSANTSNDPEDTPKDTSEGNQVLVKEKQSEETQNDEEEEEIGYFYDALEYQEGQEPEPVGGRIKAEGEEEEEEEPEFFDTPECQGGQEPQPAEGQQEAKKPTKSAVKLEIAKEINDQMEEYERRAIERQMEEEKWTMVEGKNRKPKGSSHMN